MLFVCTGNACRSQMAEGWLRRLAGDRFDVFSAGVMPAGVHPLAARVMAEAGAPIDGQTSKDVRALADRPFDLVVTLCDHARAVCPAFPRARRQVHWPFTDPIEAVGSEAVRLEAFRASRDAIRARLEAWLAEAPFE